MGTIASNLQPQQHHQQLQLQQQQQKINLAQIKYFFASRSSTFDDIWNICHNLSDDIGEQVLDLFCLTLIDHWDKEKERYVLLCERCLITLEYDFEQLQIKQLHLYDYSRFDTIRIGPLRYPEMSFNAITHRNQIAIRFGWDSHRRTTQWQSWNPWSRDIPWITLTSHPLKTYIDEVRAAAAATDCAELADAYYTLNYLLTIRRRYSIETFHDMLFEVLRSFRSTRDRSCLHLDPRGFPALSACLDGSTDAIAGPYHADPCSSTIAPGVIELYHPDHNVTIVHYAPIICDNYFNLPAAIFNHTRLGYYRLRLF